MGLFTRKQKISVVDWCEDHYSNCVFSPRIGGVDPWHTFCDTLTKQIQEIDPSVPDLTTDQWSDQLISLRLEVVGIAWMMNVKDQFAPIQSECTRRFLAKKGHQAHWKHMEPYNRATARSVLGMVDPDSRLGRGHITFINSMRAQLFDEWRSLVNKPVDAARPANRFACSDAWDSRKTQTYLSFALTDQLKCRTNDQARHCLMGVIQGMYEGVREKLQHVKITL